MMHYYHLSGTGDKMVKIDYTNKCKIQLRITWLTDKLHNISNIHWKNFISKIYLIFLRNLFATSMTMHSIVNLSPFYGEEK